MRFSLPLVARAGVATILAVLCLPVAGAQTASGLQQLQRFLDSTRSLSADFRQEVINDRGEVIETARGRLVLKRPGRFRWDYEAPYQRVVVADGQQLWLYEADLEQVTVRPLTQGLGETPAALLTGERNVLDRFEYVSAWSGEDIAWVRLKPKGADSDFESIAIGFSRGQPTHFELQDRLGQRTRIALSAVQADRPVADSVFRFEPPAGVDVIREGEL